MKRYYAEFLGTFILVFAGTAAIVVNDLHGGVITHLGIALVFGLVVSAMIYTLGDISGAHINPAVTFAFWIAGRFPGKDVTPYIISQVLGAIAASLLVYLLFPDHQTLGATLPAGSNTQSFILETILAFILVLAIINVATGAKEKGIMAGAAIGSIVAFEAIFAGPITGASMNPARSIGPALVSGHLSSIWIYIAAPLSGAFIAILSCKCIREKDCCG